MPHTVVLELCLFLIMRQAPGFCQGNVGKGLAQLPLCNLLRLLYYHATQYPAWQAGMAISYLQGVQINGSVLYAAKLLLGVEEYDCEYLDQHAC